jgi:hypothetical protein
LYCMDEMCKRLDSLAPYKMLHDKESAGGAKEF